MSQLRLGQLRRWNEEAYKEYVPGLITCEYFTLIEKRKSKTSDKDIWFYYENGLIDSDTEETLLRISVEVDDE